MLPATPSLPRPPESNHPARDQWLRIDQAVEHLADLVAADGGTAWRAGDNQGGGVLELLAVAVARRGCEVPRHPLRLPRLGTPAVAILERDAYRCVGCRDWHGLEIDHDVPRSRGGSDDPSNLQALCSRCNAEKGTMTTDEWRAWKQERGL